MGMLRTRPLTPATEALFKVMLGVLATFAGLHMAWMSLRGSVGGFFLKLLLIVLALMIGKLVGGALRLQERSNRLGHFARERMTQAATSGRARPSDGFQVCTALYCAAPLGVLGAVQDGLSGYVFPLAVKGLMEALATVGLVRIFGWGAMLSALPVLALQGTLTLALRGISPWLLSHNLVAPLNGTAGLLVFAVALVIFDVKKIQMADYLPSLVAAPLLGWLAESVAG